MTTRAKFKVETVTISEGGTSVKLRAVSGGSKENEEFFKWTPVGVIDIGLVKPEHSAQFTPGAAFYVDFIPVNT